MYIQDITIINDCNLKPSEKLLLFVLKHHTRKNMSTYVSQDMLAQECSVKRQTIMALANSLEKKKWLHIQRRKNDTHIYEFCPDKYSDDTESYIKNSVKKANNKSNTAKAIDSLVHEDMTGGVNKTSIAVLNNVTAGCNIKLHKDNIDNQNQEIKQETKSCVEKSTQPETQNNIAYQIGEKHNTKTSSTVNNFEEMWKTEILKKYPAIKHVIPFTLKEKGIIKCLSNKTQPYELIDIIRTIIEKWNEFTIYTEKNTSAFKSPLRPDLPYLTKYIESAVNFYLSKYDSKSTPNVDIDSFATNKTTKISDKDIKCQEMLNAWREIMSTNYDDFNPDAVFSSDETLRVNEFVGQFKKNNPVDVLKACLLNWGKFRTLLQEQLDVKGLPIFPSVQLICTHHTVAYLLYKETVMQPLNS